MKTFSLAIVALASLAACELAGQTYNYTTIAGAAWVVGSTDGTNGNALFRGPNGIVLDSHGDAFVADSDNHTIRKLTRSGTNWVSSTIAGLAGSHGWADGTNSDARFYLPSGLAVDARGNIFVADTLNQAVRELTPVGTNWVVTTIALDSPVWFWLPSDVAVDGSGNVFLANTDNDTIEKLTPVGTNWVVNTIAGLAETQGYADGTNSDARFWDPSGIAVDAGGCVYVADSVTCTIRKLTPVGTNWVVNTIAGKAYQHGSADGTNTDARFDTPLRVALDTSGSLYVTDYQNRTIRKLTRDGTNWVVSTIGGAVGQFGYADGTNSAARFWALSGLSVDNAGNIFLTDAGTYTIREGALLLPPPVLQMIPQPQGNLAFTWTALAGHAYQVQFLTDLTQTNWTDLGNSITATNDTASASDVIGPDAQRFYRVVGW